MKYVLILLGVLLMAEVVQTGVRVGVRVGWGKKRALVPQLEDDVIVDARNAPVSQDLQQEVTSDLQEKIKALVEEERKKFGV